MLKQTIKKIMLAALTLGLCLGAGRAERTLAAQQNSLTLEVVYHPDKDSSQAVGGGVFSVYKVADLIDKEAVFRYTAASAFGNLGIDFQHMTAGKSKEAAAQLATVVQSKQLNALAVATADASGRVSFTELEDGMYLILQTDSTGEAKDYQSLEPFLLMIPQPVQREGGIIWQKDVVAYPKAELLKKPTFPPSPPQPPGPQPPQPPRPHNPSTGERSWLYLVPLAAVSAMVIVIIIVRMRKDKR